MCRKSQIANATEKYFEKWPTSKSIADGVVDQSLDERTLGTDWENHIGRVGKRKFTEQSVGLRFEKHQINGRQGRLNFGGDSQLLVGVNDSDSIFRQVRIEFAFQPAFHAQRGVQQYG